MGLIQVLGRGPVAIDTVAFIYWIEEHPTYAPVLEPVFQAIDAGKLAAVTSGLTLLEVLVVPYRVGNIELAKRYEAFLTSSKGLRIIELDRSLLRAAAALRAKFPGLRPPDALQIAGALVGGCRSFLTNDRQLPVMPVLATIVLDQFSGKG